MKIALTFDIERDIPNMLDTYFGIRFGLIKILKIMDEFNIKGTFFCTANIVQRFPEYIRMIELKNHEIACHGFNHERLNQLDFKGCQEKIYQSKKILENFCKNSEIDGFRAPYLKPPKFLFKILNNLGFKYDSSIQSHNNLEYYQNNPYPIKEFHPSNYNIFFRFPMGNLLLKSQSFKNESLILYFHPWEAVNMRNFIFNNNKKIIDLFKKAIFRPDHWVNTGKTFIKRFRDFIIRSISQKAEFVLLKQLLI